LLTVNDLILARTRLEPVPLVPEIMLRQADEPIGLWEETERQAGRTGMDPPFWAFAWPGGQALARFVLDHREVVAGRRVLDLASGSGLVAIAAVLAGASEVIAADIDPLAVAAIGLNAAANGVALSIEPADLLAGDGAPAEVILVGDGCYERVMAARVIDFCDRARERGAAVLLGDPGRSYLPKDRLTEVAVYDCPVNDELESVTMKHTAVWDLSG
jgi:predicted nicotinamide N-methyase